MERCPDPPQPHPWVGRLSLPPPMTETWEGPLGSYAIPGWNDIYIVGGRIRGWVGEFVLFLLSGFFSVDVVAVVLDQFVVVV